MRITRSKSLYTFDYSLSLCGHVLGNVDSVNYLGVTIDSNLSWYQHIENITSKANRTLGLIRRNLKKVPQETKTLAYKALVRPNLEYCASVWDQHTNKRHLKDRNGTTQGSQICNKPVPRTSLVVWVTCCKCLTGLRTTQAIHQNKHGIQDSPQLRCHSC